MKAFRPGMIAEAAEQLVRAAAQTDPDQAAFETGMVHGYLIAFGMEPRNHLDDARREPFSECQPRLAAHPFASWRTHAATGIRWGYKQATSELPNVQECALCSERIDPDIDDYDECPVSIQPAFFCDGDDCHTQWHGGSYCEDPHDREDALASFEGWRD